MMIHKFRFIELSAEHWTRVYRATVKVFWVFVCYNFSPTLINRYGFSTWGNSETWKSWPWVGNGQISYRRSNYESHSRWGMLKDIQYFVTIYALQSTRPTNQLGPPFKDQLGPMIKQDRSHDCVLSLQILREIWKISNLLSKRTDREFETSIDSSY